jgi:hypothetical protein
MATLLSQIGESLDQRLAAHATSIAVGDKARYEFRNQAQAEFDASQKSFLSSRVSVREAADAANKATYEGAVDSFTATRDAIVNFSEDGIVNTINDFTQELENNQVAINALMTDHTAAHEAAIADILAELGTEADFVTGYGAELPAYSADDYSA